MDRASVEAQQSGQQSDGDTMTPDADRSARIVYLTAGAAGMYCGSCMHDNTIAAALHRQGVDIQLVPTYTPIRTDEQNVAAERVFFGGINVYLQERFPPFRWLPGWCDRWLDSPRLLRWISRRGMQIDADFLGRLTISMLDGRRGHQRKEVRRLIHWLRIHGRPDLIHFTNMLIAGCAEELKDELGIPLLATLQGDDIFIESLLGDHRRQVLSRIQRLVQAIDGFLVFSTFYRDFMADYFSIPADRFHVVPLGMDFRDFDQDLPRREHRPPWRIGYFARLAPEKGLHVLVEAFLKLRQLQPDLPVELHIAGWEGETHRAYVADLKSQIAQADAHDSVLWHGELDRRAKVEFLHSLDLLSVPTTYRDPKGLFIVEAWAAGVPVVQPAHGAFPELIEATGAGRLFEPENSLQLAERLAELLTDPEALRTMGQRGRQAVREMLSAETAARQTWEVYQLTLSRHRAKTET